MKYLDILTLILFTTSIYAQTPITDANFKDAIEDCLSTNPVDGLCNDSEFGPMPDWDVSQVTDISFAFFGKSAFNADISSWDVSNTVDMESVFTNGINFNQDVSSWDVSGVKDMQRMFSGTESFDQNLNSWDVSNVETMASMFNNAESFNQELSSWDVSNVNNMGIMFTGAILFNQDISSWCVEHIEREPFRFSLGSPLKEEFKPNWGAKCMTSAEDLNLLEEREIFYPNPVLDYLYADEKYNDIENITIINSLGQEVIDINVMRNSININRLEAGIYMVKYMISGRTYSQRIIKQ